MTHKADCPFCKAYAVKPPSSAPDVGWLWSLPNDSPFHLYERETKEANTLGERLTIRQQDYYFVRISRDEVEEITKLETVNAELLEACEKLVAWDNGHGNDELYTDACEIAKQAIAEIKGEK